ncbi:MAG: ABC transporter ATP-binding protein [Armatimonadota bacterium]|nr:ABC transporter ATP-binding protein [Armatimonadota bacterium]
MIAVHLEVPDLAVPEAPILRVEDLRKTFVVKGAGWRRWRLHALSGVTFDVRRGETLGLVGESGCGKSTTARCLVRLLRPDGGRIVFDGQDITRLTDRQFWPLRRRIQMVFQDPTDSLNPRMTVEEMVGEPLDLHFRLTPRERMERIVAVLTLVGLKDEHLDRYPHQLSIGQQQRVGIARAVATGADLLVLDEPTSALDVSVRGMVLRLLEELRERLHMTYVFISHDLSVVKHICHRVAVMYLGMVVEVGSTEEIFRRPRHPYTEALLQAVPIPDPRARRERLILPGEVPSPLSLPAGCFFYSRCSIRREECATTPQWLRPAGAGHYVACHVRVP